MSDDLDPELPDVVVLALALAGTIAGLAGLAELLVG